MLQYRVGLQTLHTNRMNTLTGREGDPSGGQQETQTSKHRFKSTFSICTRHTAPNAQDEVSPQHLKARQRMSQ